MRTHGWGGNVPLDDDEAIARILAATRTCIDRKGAGTSLADVARELGVTRQTVYRYFAGTDDLLAATAVDAVGEMLDRMAQKLQGIHEPDVAVVEGLVAVFAELSSDGYIGLSLNADHLSVPMVGQFTSDLARDFARSVVSRLDVDWVAWGFADEDLEDVVEIVLRTVQSLIVDRAGGRSEEELRRLLRRWTGAAIREMCSADAPVSSV